MSETDEMLKSSQDALLPLSTIEGASEIDGRIEVAEQSYVRALEILDGDTTPAPGLIKLMSGRLADESDDSL